MQVYIDALLWRMQMIDFLSTTKRVLKKAIIEIFHDTKYFDVKSEVKRVEDESS